MSLFKLWPVCFFVILPTLAVYGDVPASKSYDALRQYKEGLHPWEGATRGFRGEHHLALSVGGTSSLWDFSVEENTVKGLRGSSVFCLVSYEFHMRIQAGIGYFLGSRAGGILNSSMDEPDNFRQISIQRQIILPGFSTGILLNINPIWRIGLGLDLFLERLEGFSVTSGEEDLRNRSSTGRGWSWGVTIDWFYSLGWGLRGNYQWTSTRYSPSHFGYERWDQAGSIGIIHHLL